MFDLYSFKTDPLSESRIEKPHPVYVPRDETFEEIKQDTLASGRLKALLHNLIPSIAASLSSSDISFSCFSEIDKLYNDGFMLKHDDPEHGNINRIVAKLMNQVLTVGERLFKYEIPAIIQSMYSSISLFLKALSFSSSITKHLFRFNKIYLFCFQRIDLHGYGIVSLLAKLWQALIR